MDLPTVVASYLIGSISFPWLIAWWYGIDLRTAGARKLGGSDLARVLGMRWGIAGGGLDAAKGALVVLIASALGLPDETRALCAIAAVAGQMWPVFHDLDGGRANATGWGALLALDVIAAAIAAIPLAAALAARYTVKPPPRRVTPIAALLTFLVWPAVIWEGSGLTPLVVGGLIIFLLIAVRRVTAGLDADIRTGAPLGRILLDRLLFDRTALQESGAVPI
jgi:glycerol-3-phosphate acyltransferase PlsY